MRFVDQVVLVTGGGSGIGRAAALAFAAEGAAVAVAGRSPEPLAQTVKLVEATGGTASFVTADVTREEDVAAMVDTVVARYGGLHVAFNNAGTFVPGGVADLPVAEWSR